MKIIITDAELDRYNNIASDIVEEIISPEITYAPHFIQIFYNDVLLPQVIVNETLKKHKGIKNIEIVVNELSIIIYLKYNEHGEGKGDNLLEGYMYSKELI